MEFKHSLEHLLCPKVKNGKADGHIHIVTA